MKNLVFVFALLLTLACCTTEADRDRMHAGLDSINQRNRNDQPFTVADVEPYVQFFDDHGTPNDRLLAHYLLGRAYHDHGEAPMALECYQKAIDHADTLSADCSYKQLCRVYAQMAQIFYEQGLYREQLTSDQLSVKYAWKGKDTLAALMSYAQQSLAYRNLNMPDSLLYICEHVSQLYRKYGYTNYAASSLFYTLRTLILRQEFDKVRKNMQIYESESEYFDSLGNIQKGREIYYRIKGLYFLKTNVLDSAEYYFRKELRYGKDFDNQHSAALGLAELYHIRQISDSSLIYYKYAYAMSDSLYARRTTKEIERIQSMYDYTRHQEIAHQEQKKANQRTIIIWICVAAIIFICIITYIVIRRLSHKRHEIEQQYIHNLEQLEQTQSEVLQLRAHADEYEELLAMKEKSLYDQSAKFQKQRNKSLQDHSEIDKKLYESPICQKLLANQHIQKLTIQELRDCRRLVLENLPVFNNLLMSKKYAINEKDFNVCVLFRLGFKSKEVSNMLDISPGRVSQICTKVLHEVFGKEEGGAAELIEILHELH